VWRIFVEEGRGVNCSLESYSKNMRFQVFMAADYKMIAFWDIVLCSLVEVD
jgi:hypothetical protein